MLITTVLKYLIGESSLLAPDFASFRRQEFSFIGLNIFLAIALLLTQIAFPDQFGRPDNTFFLLLAVWIAFNCLEFLWLGNRTALVPEMAILLTWTTIATNAAVAFGLAYLSYRQDIQYFTLIVSPIFQAAFRLSLNATLFTIGISDGLIFFWVWNYFRLHPPTDVNEYVEAATISVIYTVVGLLIWILVNHLRLNQVRLARNLSELEAARTKLIQQEKLAAVGRFSAAIAHEIRNPVAMILGALLLQQQGPEPAFKRASGNVRYCNEGSFQARTPDNRLSDLRTSAAYKESARRYLRFHRIHLGCVPCTRE